MLGGALGVMRQVQCGRCWVLRATKCFVFFARRVLLEEFWGDIAPQDAFKAVVAIHQEFDLSVLWVSVVIRNVFGAICNALGAMPWQGGYFSLPEGGKG